MGWMDSTAGALWSVLLLSCVLLAIVVVIATVSLLRSPPDEPERTIDRRQPDQEFTAGRISEQDYRAARAQQDARGGTS